MFIDAGEIKKRLEMIDEQISQGLISKKEIPNLMVEKRNLAETLNKMQHPEDKQKDNESNLD